MGLPGTEALLSPVSCRQDSRLHDLPWVPKGRLEELLITGGAARKPPEMRLRKWKSCTRPNLVRDSTLGPVVIKPFIRSSGVGTHSFSRQEPAVSPFAWQSNKAILFYFTQNSVPEIWFGSGVQRGWAFGISFPFVKEDDNSACLVGLLRGSREFHAHGVRTAPDTQ